MKLNPALRSFWTTKARNKILKGGRASSKSHDAAGFAVYLASNYTLRFLCVRQIQNKISESVYSLLKVKIDESGMKDDFTITQNSIRHNVTGSEFLFYGLWRNPDEIKSIEGIDILWSEESHALTAEQWAILEPTVRKEDSEIWILFNPNLVTDFVYRRFVVNPPPDTIIRHINYDENPFLSKTMLKIIEAAKAEDEAYYNHVYLGQPKEDSEESVIKRSWVTACIDAHIKLGIEPTGKKVIGYDVADSGGDSNAYVLRHGCYIYDVVEWQAGEHEIGKSASKVYERAASEGAEIFYDSIGVGAGVGAKFKEINDNSTTFVTFNKFNAGDSVRQPEQEYKPGIKNKDHFANLKAQEWWGIADRMRATYNAINGEPYNEDDIISISSSLPNLEKLIVELTTPLKDYDNHGRVKVESKKDLKKRGIESPNIADAAIMCLAQPYGDNMAILDYYRMMANKAQK